MLLPNIGMAFLIIYVDGLEKTKSGCIYQIHTKGIGREKKKVQGLLFMTCCRMPRNVKNL
jgi:hypothetical protein